MSRLFISHSSQDKEAVQEFVEFLVLGMAEMLEHLAVFIGNRDFHC